MKKINKKGLLSFLTVSAIVVTTVGSFAVWDKLSEHSTGTLSVRKPVVISTTNISNFTEEEVDGMPAYTTDVTFSVADLPVAATASTLTLNPVIKDGGTDVTTSFDIKIKDGNAPLGADGIDGSVTETNTYTVTVTPIDGQQSTVGGKDLAVDIGATLDVKEPAN